MTYIPGSIPVTGFIGPTDSTDTYAVTDSIYGIDGYRSLSSTTVRNAITTERRREGMLVYTQNDQNIWQLLPEPWTGADSDWKLFISSAITSFLSASTLSGTFLPLSGGTVTGDTYFTTQLSATTFSSGTIHITSTTAPLNLPVLSDSFSSTTHGDVWISTGATRTFLNVVIGGVTKSVELT